MMAWHRDERGITLAELLVGSSLAVLTLTIVIVWIVATSRVEVDQSQDLDALNAMRTAREQIVKELRFVDGVLPTTTPNTIDTWVDVNGNGTGPDAAGERVTWQIIGGRMIRYEDGNPAIARELLAGVVDSSSQLSVAGRLATIELVVAVPQGRTTAVRTVKTQVLMRNVQP